MLSTAIPGPLESDLRLFIARIVESPDLLAAAARCGVSKEDAPALLATYANEALVGLRLVEPLLRPGMRVLEVGCGIGTLARFLLDQGVDLTAIEPGASGFGFMPEIGMAILDLAPARVERWIGIGAEQLNPTDHGRFDLIYSVSVMEHIPSLDEAFKGMASVLAPGGVMVHQCPNYVVPYEPHFGIPLIPFFPGATRPLFPRRTASLPGVWEELNFITAPRVRRLARKHGLSVTFDKGVMGSAVRRLRHDTLFRERQGQLASVTQLLLGDTGLVNVLDHLPGALATPMIMRLSHADRAGNGPTAR